ncbi:hypothetical protein L8U00_02580, partial [Campylobacter sp. IFREMER_LSEM_CL2256]|uniref:hypothetical protein n=1 Tax=Campylobacter sp. IFREMER_LSEM_CL2256 TaxID=2911622 RepID=UPI0021E95DD5
TYPSFKGQEKTIDYMDDFSIKVSGLLPNSTIDKITGSNGVKAKKDSFNVNENGEAVLEFSSIGDFSVKETNISFYYVEHIGEQKVEFKLDPIRFFEYKIEIEAPEQVVEEGFFDVTLKNGKPKAEIEWLSSPLITPTSPRDNYFNDKGEAHAKYHVLENTNNIQQIIVKTLGGDFRKNVRAVYKKRIRLLFAMPYKNPYLVGFYQGNDKYVIQRKAIPEGGHNNFEIYFDGFEDKFIGNEITVEWEGFLHGGICYGRIHKSITGLFYDLEDAHDIHTLGNSIDCYTSSPIQVEDPPKHSKIVIKYAGHVQEISVERWY